MESSFLINIHRLKCDHASELRTFKIINGSMTFEKLEGQFLCREDALFDISLSKNEEGPWTKLEDGSTEGSSADLYQVPIGMILQQFPGTKYFRLKCLPQEQQAETSDTSEVKNAFDVMMSNSKAQTQTSFPSKKRSRAGVKEGLSRKDELYNQLIDWMETRGLSLRNASSEGSYITQVLCNALWYVTNQHAVINTHSQKEEGVLAIPVAFSDFQGFNEHRRKKLKSLPLESSQLKNHAEILLSLCSRPVMKSTPEWELAYNDIKLLAECFLSYHDYLIKQKEKTEKNQNLLHPVRQVSEDTSVWTVQKTLSGIKPKYSALDKALSIADYNEPIFFDEDHHIDKRFEDGMQRFRYFENIQLSVTVDIYKYCPGGGVTTLYCFTKVYDTRSDAEKMSQIAMTMAKIKPLLPEYHTRQMKRVFRERFSNISSVKPSVADMLYKELTLDASSASSPEIQQRLRLIFMGETGLIADLRQMNKGHPGDSYDVFFSRLSEVVEEFTAADERCHNVAHNYVTNTVHKGFDVPDQRSMY